MSFYIVSCITCLSVIRSLRTVFPVRNFLCIYWHNIYMKLRKILLTLCGKRGDGTVLSILFHDYLHKLCGYGDNLITDLIKHYKIQKRDEFEVVYYKWLFKAAHKKETIVKDIDNLVTLLEKFAERPL